MKRRHSVRRRPNGVGAYHIYLGQLLKKAKTEGKSKAERNAAFKKAQAQALKMKGKYGAKAAAAAKTANSAVQAKKLKRRAQRGRRLVAGPRGGKRVVPAMKKAAYKALKPYARLKVRKAAGAVVARGPRKAKAATRRPPSIRAASVKAASRKAATAKKATRRKAASRKAGFSGVRIGAKGRSMYFLGGKMVSQAKYRAARPGSGTPASQMLDNPRRRRKGARKAHRRMGMMRRLRNTGGSVLAAEKSFYGDLVSVQGALAALGVGVAHGVVGPMVADRLASMLPGRISLPVVGEVGAANLAFTATGLVAGGALVAAGTMLPGQKALLNKMAMLAVGSGVVLDLVGVVMNRDAAPADEESFGAIDNQGTIYGDIAYGAIDNDGTVYGDIAYGGLMEDGMNVSYGDIMLGEYADAMPADAQESGADFSTAEGQALMDGPLAWFRRFGKSPVRAMGVRGAKSRHAGREGHRWGWLIKLVGPDKARQIAALPPEKRLDVINSLRKAAIDSLANALNVAAAQTTAQVAPAQNLLPAPQDMGLDLTGAVAGAGGSYGATMYAGNGF